MQSSQLINQSVYGPDFGGAFGPDNVHLIGQGQFIFNPLVTGDGDIYFRLSFTGHMSLNGQVDKDFANDASGYRATLITTYKLEDQRRHLLDQFLLQELLSTLKVIG